MKSSPRYLRVRLSAFMFLQYFTWGAWYVSLGAYLANQLRFGGQQIGTAYGAFAVGAMIAPFFVGLIADRYFATEKLLAVLGVAGGLTMFALAQVTTFATFYPVLLLYCLLFAPTLALGNSLSLHHLADAKRDFPRVKVLSAVGWAAGGITLSLLRGDQTATQFYLAGTLSVAFGVYALTLPSTPPKKVGNNVTVGEILGLDALALLKKPPFAIFVVCLFLICIPLYFYFVMMAIYLTELGWTGITAKLSVSQISDITFLLLLPVILKRLGYKMTFVIGILAWATRYFFLAGSVGFVEHAALLIFMAILLHGVCYDFLFIAGQLYVDEVANERIRGATQGFIAFVLWGVGAFVGTHLAGRVLAANALPVPDGTILHEWSRIWTTPALGAVAVLVVFVIFFRNPVPAPKQAPLRADGTEAQPASLPVA